jgi:8-oxo-dGTP diphosphatase
VLEAATGVAVAVIRDGTVLLGRRIAAHGNGLLQLPGGKPDFGEPLASTAIREVREETGLDIRDPREVAQQIDDFPAIGKSYLTHFFVASAPPGIDAINCEPDKCEGWTWYALDALPDDLFAIDATTIAAIRTAAYGAETSF